MTEHVPTASTVTTPSLDTVHASLVVPVSSRTKVTVRPIAVVVAVSCCWGEPNPMVVVGAARASRRSRSEALLGAMPPKVIVCVAFAIVTSAVTESRPGESKASV